MSVEASLSSDRLKTDECVCLAMAEIEELTEKEIGGIAGRTNLLN